MRHHPFKEQSSNTSISKDGDFSKGSLSVKPDMDSKKEEKYELKQQLRDLRVRFRIHDKEKDSLHFRGMKVNGEERTILFREAVEHTNAIALIRREINTVSKKLKRL